MRRTLVLGAIAALWGISGCAAHRSGSVSGQDPPGVLSDANIGTIKAGSSTRADVKAAIGNPWRITNYGEVYCGCPHKDFQEVWDYRGTDTAGSYRLHIEFDDGGIARTVAKVQGPHSSVTILASSKPPEGDEADGHHAHHHHSEGTQ